LLDVDILEELEELLELELDELLDDEVSST